MIALLEVTSDREGMEIGPADEKRLSSVAEGVARVLTHARLDDSRHAPERITGLIGKSAAMLALYAAVERAANVRTPVLLVGACGVGKTRIATAIHHLQLGQNAPLITVQCHPEHAFAEAELFGLPRSATSAGEYLPGAAERASGGTLLVEQIDLLPVDAQKKLLEYAQRCDARIVATVLRAPSPRGAIPGPVNHLARELQVETLNVPSIAERGPDDVAMLALHFVRDWAGRLQRSEMSISSSALARLRSQSWPGNVHELEKCLQSAVLACDGDSIEVRHLHLPSAGAGGTATDSIPSGLLLADAEERYILRTLTEHQQNRTRTATSLGIGRNTLVRKIKQYQNK